MITRYKLNNIKDILTKDGKLLTSTQFFEERKYLFNFIRLGKTISKINIEREYGETNSFDKEETTPKPIGFGKVHKNATKDNKQ